ncbi:MAG: NADH:flavin oxidoreductase [Anaerolineae bacterium]
MLFSPTKIGSLELPNRLVRSATAECLADAEGRPLPKLKTMYEELACGGVGLIITGHMYVHRNGKAHAHMMGIDSDELISGLSELADVVHDNGGRVAVQINHGGMNSNAESVHTAIAPSDVELPSVLKTARAMSSDEVEMLVDAYAQAARRVQEAGFDGVQIHTAHGYLISQFLSPLVNRRTDEWGGDLRGRLHFLRAVCEAVRGQVGPTYPVFVKLGVKDGQDGGLTLEEGLQVASSLGAMSLDAVEISVGLGTSTRVSSKPGDDDAYFRPWARQASAVTDLPVILVGGLRSRQVMEDVLRSGDADLVSLCRPLICEPDLPNRMRLGRQERSSCISANRCWTTEYGEGVSCKCPLEKAV